MFVGPWHHWALCQALQGVTGKNRTVSDLGEGTQIWENPSVTLQWPRTQGIQKSAV